MIKAMTSLSIRWKRSLKERIGCTKVTIGDER